MRKVNPKSDNNDSFKCSILISLHYHHIPDIFEKNNPHTSLVILDENNKLIYSSNNDSINKEYIVKINEDRCAAIKPSSNNRIKIKQLIKKLSQAEFKEISVYLIKYYNYQQLSKVLMDTIKNNILLESE